MVTSKTDIIDKILSNKEKIFFLGVARLGLFGSFVRDEAE